MKKTTDSQYRDRASERRTGEGNDYAQVCLCSSLAKPVRTDDFVQGRSRSRRVRETNCGKRRYSCGTLSALIIYSPVLFDSVEVEAQRRYLGGDSDHSILVKGLDHALLEQNRARAANSTEDDDMLEQTFQSTSIESNKPKKRTREDLIRELKEKRAHGGSGGERAVPLGATAEEEARLLEVAKKQGKFKPIGFKPIGGASEEKGKKKKTKGEGKDGERKKKKRKVEADGDKVKGEMLPPSGTASKVDQLVPSTSKVVEPEPAPPEDFDIFADVGDYEELDDGDDDDDDGVHEQGKLGGSPRSPKLEDGEEPSSSATEARRWIASDEPDRIPHKAEPDTSTRGPGRSPPHRMEPEDDESEDEERPTRLIPLASSVLPSIKEFLAMEQAAGGGKGKGKGKKRKEKTKEGGQGDDEDSKKKTAEAKAERDYKRWVILIDFYDHH